MYSYTIYTTITCPTLSYMYCSWVYYTVTIRQTYCSHTLDIIVLVSSTMFQTYDISCGYVHMPLYLPINKREIKSKKIDKRKRKSK